MGERHLFPIRILTDVTLLKYYQWLLLFGVRYV